MRTSWLTRRVAREVHPLLGVSGSPSWTAVERHEGALPRFDHEHPGRRERWESALPEGLVVLGNFTRGLGLASLVAEARSTSGLE